MNIGRMTDSQAKVVTKSTFTLFTMNSSRTLLLLLILASTSLLTATAQRKNALGDAEKKSILKNQATQMVAAFNRGDLERFASFTYPQVLQSIGGKAAMVNLIKGQMQQWEQQEMGIDSVWEGEPSQIYKAGNELHALINQQLVLHVKNGTLNKNSYLLAISSNGGVNWYFLDTAPLNSSNIQKLFPNFNKEIVIPAKQEPVFTPKN